MADQPVKLVIFDCDGVLVDSEPLAMRILLRVIESQGITIAPDEAFRNYLGRSVASSSGVERITLSLELTGLLPRFGDRIYSASMVERGKPAPDLFLHAAAA